MQNMGNATPSPIAAPPATAANTYTPNQAFAQGLAASAGNGVPAFANNYMAFAQPMNMIGYRGVF
jgi:hypothetical protein